MSTRTLRRRYVETTVGSLEFVAKLPSDHPRLARLGKRAAKVTAYLPNPYPIDAISHISAAGRPANDPA